MSISEGPGGKDARVDPARSAISRREDGRLTLTGRQADVCQAVFSRRIGPFSGQAVISSMPAPEKLGYAVNRYRREIERH